MKVIFLDIDGVLNNAKNFLHAVLKVSGDLVQRGQFDPDCVRALNSITEQSGANLVLASTWRLGMPFKTMRKILRQQGVGGNLVDYTPYLTEPIPGIDRFPTEDGSYQPVRQLTRGKEIQAWLDGVEQVDNFVILDDDSDMDHLQDHLVRTVFEEGLRLEHVEKALALLNRR